jgi:hypothetical protein
MLPTVLLIEYQAVLIRIYHFTYFCRLTLASLFSPLFCPFSSTSGLSYKLYKDKGMKGLIAYDCMS